MNIREKLLSLAIVMLIAMNAYDSHQVGQLRTTVHEQRVKLLKHCIQEYGIRNCEY